MRNLQHFTLHGTLKVRPTGRLLIDRWRCNAFELISLGLLTLSLFGQPAYAFIQPPDQQTPDQLIIGGNTGLNTPKTIARDSHGNIYVNNEGRSITAYAPDAAGNSVPLRTLNTPGSTAGNGYYTHNGIAIDVQNNLYVCDKDTIKVFAEGAYGDIGSATAPISRSITLPAIFTDSLSCSIGLDGIGNIYALAQVQDLGSTVYVFDPEQTGVASPLHTITNLNPNISPGFAVDLAGTVFLSTSDSLVDSRLASIYIYAPGVQDDATTSPPTPATPNSVISGAKTGLHTPTGIALDNLGNIHVVDNDIKFGSSVPGAAEPSIRVFAAGAYSNVAAVRTIGDISHLNTPIGLTVAKNGNIYVTDQLQHSVNSYLRNVAPTPCGPGVSYLPGIVVEFSLPCVPTSSKVFDVLGTGSLPNLDSNAYIEWDWIKWDIHPGSWFLLSDYFSFQVFFQFHDINIWADHGYLFASDVLAPTNNLLKVEGTATLTDATPAEGCASKFGCKRLLLQYDPSLYNFTIPRRTFNHLGNPFPFTVGLNSVRFVVKDSDGKIKGVYTPRQAAQKAAKGNAPKALLPTNEFFIWDGAANEWFDFSDTGPKQGRLGYMKSFWFVLLNENYKTEQIELLIPNEAAQKNCDGLPIWVVSSCKPTTLYALGQTGPGGGIVFDVNSDGSHGLEAAPVDLANSAWGCYATVNVGTSTAVGMGKANTAAIVDGCDDAGTAAQVADAYILGDFDDWYLPSIDELALLYAQKSFVSGFDNGEYWSSSEGPTNPTNTSYFLNRTNGNRFVSRKSQTLGVRAVRGF